MDNIKIEKIVSILTERADAAFVFVADHRETDDLYDVLYYSELEIEEYDLRVVERELEKIIGYDTELNNLKNCDCLFIGEMLLDAKLVFCRDEKEKNRFLASVFQQRELMNIKREIMKVRIKESGVAYEQ